ncbi:MAG: TerD family protein [Pseudomonadota bacterium]
MPQLERGDNGPLNQTMQSKQRVVAGLSWDAREQKVGLLDKFLKHDSQHDLDISCYIYNRDGEFVDFVGAEAQDSMDQSESIYHSGDDMSGEGEGDDERISVELASLPPEIKTIVFLIEVRSAHNFEDVLNPQVRIVDSFKEENLLFIDINHEEGKEKNAFVFAALNKDTRESPTGWMLHHVADYPNLEKIEDWGEYLKRYCT